VRSYEHRAVGDAATGAAMVNVGGESADEAFWLSFGDVVALSGDFLRPGVAATTGLDHGRFDKSQGAVTGRLFDLARVPGGGGTRLDTRDEIVCALKVASLDEGVADPRFQPGGRFGHFRFSPSADRSDVERAVRDRYLSLAAANDDHFVAPGRSDARTGSGAGSAPSAYHSLHEAALELAWSLGRGGGDLSRAMGREAAAQHYLTDAFASGHLRTPVAAIRRYWKGRYPGFWEQLQRRVASDTARALRELSWAIRVLPAGYLHRRTLSELTTRTGGYPELSVGDLVARCLHDWDNAHGLEVDGGGVVFGDGHIDEGTTTELALAGVRAGNDDIEVAFELGSSRPRLSRDALYEAVRQATGARGAAFVAETKIPRLSASNPTQNWKAPDAESLWESPIVGTGGTTVGTALATMLEPGGQFIRQLDGLGRGLAGSHGLLGSPVVGPWLSRRCCQAFHDGFVEPLARHPEPVLLGLVGSTGASSGITPPSQ
jgi:hypothetical protein